MTQIPKPLKPGVILKRKLQRLNIKISFFAKQIKVSRQLIHRIILGKTGITPEMALRLGKFFGETPEYWLSLQRNYDLYFAKKKISEELNSIKFWQRN